ncbi:hypothetical protein M427DRAFT_58018 [Gonapodya prolifera JEL478]|uniref:Uncharacterized protein n=1 Tax=Gonapodya prolifera (strain JEL478) TaxID=1344416 RepID=A0A139AC24_GONPJ|nr:hypothetical protein M427DRAFT_58018 [Gonapodya prolifera JEL478]|eukprot:KXS14025.1 hypothetical protein M427DRAFT_58018 [Gonapodya prolifera JEL478]
MHVTIPILPDEHHWLDALSAPAQRGEHHAVFFVEAGGDAFTPEHQIATSAINTDNQDIDNISGGVAAFALEEAHRSTPVNPFYTTQPPTSPCVRAPPVQVRAETALATMPATRLRAHSFPATFQGSPICGTFVGSTTTAGDGTVQTSSTLEVPTSHPTAPTPVSVSVSRPVPFSTCTETTTSKTRRSQSAPAPEPHSLLVTPPLRDTLVPLPRTPLRRPMGPHEPTSRWFLSDEAFDEMLSRVARRIFDDTPSNISVHPPIDMWEDLQC